MDSGGYLLSARCAIVALLRCRLHRSFAYRSSASLHPAQRALGSVMSQVKRCAQSDSGTEDKIIVRDRKTKRPQLRTLCFWIPAGDAERPLCGMKRSESPVSNERCKRQRSSATIANCNTYSPGFTVRKGRVPSSLKRLGILPCSLGFRLAISPTGRARLQPVFSQAL